MRISVHLCQRKFLKKHLRFSMHVSHVSFIPPLVVKRYVPYICHVRTFPVLLVMRPVHPIRVFVHPIYAWKQIHVWIQICSEWNEATLDGSRCLALMYCQTLGWSYVITPGMQRFDKQCWQKVLEWRYVRTNTDSVLYLFLTCTRPPDWDTDHGTKTRIPWKLQSNEGILPRPHLRTTKRPTPQKMRRPVLA
jgi:hypothetical protein